MVKLAESALGGAPATLTVLRPDATEFRYERGDQPLPRIGPWQDALDGMLASNEIKLVRERLTLIRMFEALRGLGYEGGYDAMWPYARVWQRDPGGDIGGARLFRSVSPPARRIGSTGDMRSC